MDGEATPAGVFEHERCVIVAASKHQVDVAIAVEVDRIAPGRSVSGSVDLLGFGETSIARTAKQQIGSAPAEDDDVIAPVAIDICEHGPARGPARSAHRLDFDEAVRAAIGVDQYGQTIAHHRQIGIAVPIEVAADHRIARAEACADRPRFEQAAIAQIEIGPVLLRPVTSIGRQHVEIAVPVYIGESDVGGELAFPFERKERAVAKLLRRGGKRHDRARDQREQCRFHQISIPNVFSHSFRARLRSPCRPCRRACAFRSA